MTTFEDGPARGHTLMLKRTPIFLRVVALNGKWDALDQPADSPDAAETIFAYKLHEHKGSCHINAGRGRSGFYPIATYRLVPEQPTDATMREQWTPWCDEQGGL